MKTRKEIAEKLKMHTRTVIYRSKVLGIKPSGYRLVDGFREAEYSDSDAESILNYVPNKTGRKRKIK